MSTPLRVWLFGAFDVQVDGHPLSRLRTRRGLWLLALLVLRHDREVDRSWLAGTLWPDSSESNALRSLRQTLADLRQALGDEARRLTSPRARTLRLDLKSAAVDVVAFDTAIKRGDAASLEAAVALHRGPLLEGWTEEWVFEHRRAREQAYLGALERLAELALRTGDPVAAAHALRRATVADPLRESAQRALMAALAASGEYAAATQVYRELRLLLHRELNAAPAPETIALHEAIRDEARPRAGEVRGPKSPLSLDDPRSSSSPLRVSASGSSGLPPAPGPCPPASALRATSRSALHDRPNLPQPLTPTLGREREIREIRAWLASGRLVTLTGAGGVGKTRLAIQVAHEVAGNALEPGLPSGRAAFVDLAPLADWGLVPQAVAQAAGVAEQPDRPITGTLLAALRDRPLLLVLDNCEHLVDACADLADTLLGGCPELRILATSRQPLGLTGEVAWRVPSLPLPDVQEMPPPGILVQYAGVRLFLERAQAAQPGFTLTPQNAGPVLEVCRRLDGIPLALELAAAWVRTLSVQQISERVADGFRLLTTTGEHLQPGTRLSRHRTLRAAIEWSYDLLTEEEKALLGRLSVFAGGWSLDAAESVGGDGPLEVLALLSRLIDKSLVHRSDDLGPNAEPGRDEARYRMLETVRQFAREQLEMTGEAARICDRHRNFFLALAECAEAARYGPLRRGWLDRLEVEHDNLRVALRESPSGSDGALRLSASLWWFWSIRGHWAEGRSWLEGALAARPAPPAARRAQALLRAGMLAFRLADYPAARQLYAEGLDAHRAAGDLAGVAGTLYRMGEMAEAQGEYSEARRLLEGSLATARESGDTRAVSQALAGLGTIAETCGDDGEAMALYEESLALLRGLGERPHNIALLLKMGQLLQRIGDPAAACPFQAEALAISQELGDRGGVAFSLNCLGLARLAVGDTAEAKALLGEALAIGREVGDERSVAWSLHHCGLVAHACGEVADAGALLREALAKQWAMGDRRGASVSLLALGHVAKATGDDGRAVRLWGACSTLADTLGRPRALSEQADLKQSTAAARCRLGDELYADEWEAGAVLGWEGAVAFALHGPAGSAE